MEEALKTLKIADHLLSTTYPLVKDPKILIGVLSNLHIVYDRIILLTVRGHQVFQPRTFVARYEQFKQLVGEKLNEEELRSIKVINELYEEHNESPVEFTRKQQMVICSPNYSLKTLTYSSLKRHVVHAKSIVKKLLVLKNDRTS